MKDSAGGIFQGISTLLMAGALIYFLHATEMRRVQPQPDHKAHAELEAAITLIRLENQALMSSILKLQERLRIAEAKLSVITPRLQVRMMADAFEQVDDPPDEVDSEPEPESESKRKR